MAHADAIRVNQSLIHQSQLLFGYGQQRRQSPICQATPHDVCLWSILRRKGTLVIYQYEKFVCILERICYTINEMNHEIQFF